MFYFFIFWHVCITILLLPIQTAAQTAPSPRCVAIVGTNDIHGAIEPYQLHVDDKTVRYGGLVTLSGYVHILRQHFGERLLLLDAGDLYQGTLASNLSRGAAIIAALNDMRYDAAAIGNHEFDFGSELVPENISSDPLAVIKARIAQAHFPFLAINIIDKARGALIDWPNTYPSRLFIKDGIKIGVIGASTTDTPRSTQPKYIAGLSFIKPTSAIVQEAHRLRAQGAQLMVLVAHMGGHCASLKNPLDAQSCIQSKTHNVDSELTDLLQQLPQGTIDVAIGGHTHQFIGHWIHGTATIESGSQALYLGWVEACLQEGGVGINRQTSSIHAAHMLCLDSWTDGTCRNIKHATAVAPARFLNAPVTPQPSMLHAMQPYLDAVNTLGQRSIQSAPPKRLSADDIGKLVTEAMRLYTQADIGILQSRRSIRSALPAGPLNFSQVFQSLPFENKIVTMHLTYDQLYRLIRVLHQHDQTMPYLDGMRIDSKTNSNWQLLDTTGHALDQNRLYSLSTIDFLLDGGSGAQRVFKELNPESVTYASISTRDALIKILQERYPVQHTTQE